MESAYVKLLRSGIKTLATPTGAALAIGAGPVAGEMVGNTKDRYHRIRDDLLEAPYVPAGERTVTANARTFVEKRAALQQGQTKIAIPVPPPSLAGKILQWAAGNKGMLLGGGPLIGLGILGAPAIGEMGQRLRQNLFGNPLDRANMVEEGAKSFASSVGKQLGIQSTGLLGDLLSKTVQAPSMMMQNRAQQSVFEMLRQEDEVLSQADPQQLLEAYHTMTRFAPTLATDKNAVKTFLRESVLYGSGPNVVSIKQLADAEHAINPPEE